MAARTDRSAPDRDSVLPVGSITDVSGIHVGHHQRIGRGWQTGTTVVYVPNGATPGVSVRGGGPGTRETDALRPENLVQEIHAVCLTGGSAFGLAAADGVVSWLEERGLGFPVGPADDLAGVVPVVPAAVVFDLGRAGRFDHRPTAEFGRRAIASAKVRQRSWGSVGAGTGARAGGLQGGVGTASTTVAVQAGVPATNGEPASTPLIVHVGALAVVNANGTAIDPATGLPWDPDAFGLRTPSARDRARLLRRLSGQAADLNTTIGVVATTAALSKSEVSKMADVAHDGLARAIRPAHSMFDGDTIFGLATGRHDIGNLPAGMRSTPSRQTALNLILRAAADTFAAASAHAVLAATTLGDTAAYLDLCPSTLPRSRGRTTSAQ
ncbi:MAG TPA: P1 family peptidase [Ilumatobacteraceae bacterium]|nr:P1 family peptidase [Ilumatobacteraceae bacterium]